MSEEQKNEKPTPDWKKYRERPLILVEHAKVGEAIKFGGYKPDDAFEKLAEPHKLSEDYLYEILEKENLDEAIKFMSCIYHRRVEVWWGYVCVKQVTDEVDQNIKARIAAGEPVDYKSLKRASLGLPAKPPKVAGAAKEEPPLPPYVPQSYEEMLPDVPDTYEGQPIPKGVDDWPQPHLDVNGSLQGRFPEPVASRPDRELEGMEEFYEDRRAAMQAMSPEDREWFLGREQQAAMDFEKATGQPPGDFLVSQFKQWVETESAIEEKAPSPYEKITAANRRAEAEIDQKMAAGKAQIAAARTQIPKMKDRPLANSSRAGEALELARKWIIGPTDPNARAAFAIGKKCKGGEKAAGFVALSAFYSNTTLGPADREPVPPPPQLTPRVINGALTKASIAKGGTRGPEERKISFIDQGLRVGQGELTWDSALKPGQTRHSWSGMSGFGRNQDSRLAEPDGGTAAGPNERV